MVVDFSEKCFKVFCGKNLQIVQQRSSDRVAAEPIQTGVCTQIQSSQGTQGK